MKGLTPWIKWWLKEKARPVRFPESPAEPRCYHLPYLDYSWLLVPWVCRRKQLIGSLETGFLVALRQTHTKILANWCELPVLACESYFLFHVPSASEAHPFHWWQLNGCVLQSWTVQIPPHPKSISNTQQKHHMAQFLQCLTKSF